MLKAIILILLIGEWKTSIYEENETFMLTV